MGYRLQIGKKMFNVIETFSGIGAQAKAFSRIAKEHEVNILNTCDWDISAIIAYCRIHKGEINTDKYSDVTDAEIDSYLSARTLSVDGKKPISEQAYNRLSSEFKRLLYSAIRETANLVSITDVKGSDIPDNVDLLTYSFPCQDLSLCGAWHGNTSGIARDAHNRSGMLWEVERILKEMYENGQSLPRFLVMENVCNILSQTNKADFDDWKGTLVNLGYYNKIYRLNAKNFGLPQKRERAYMVSVYTGGEQQLEDALEAYLREHNLEEQEYVSQIEKRSVVLSDIIRSDYDGNDKYRLEAEKAQPNDTPSRQRIFEENDKLFFNGTYYDGTINTVTTKQDRNPNSGLIEYVKREGKPAWRYLTPRECFLLMGFDESDYDRIVSGQVEKSEGKTLFTEEKLYKMAGNSICVDVLEALFRQIMEIKTLGYVKD